MYKPATRVQRNVYGGFIFFCCNHRKYQVLLEQEFFRISFFSRAAVKLFAVLCLKIRETMIWLSGKQQQTS